jgi:ribosome-binding factor A
MQELVDDLGPEDGIDPREAIRRSARKKGGRKTLQLCGQVAQALNFALAAVCDDDVLRELTVVAVQPGPDEARLIVTLGPSLPGPFDPTQVLVHLERALGKLRYEVAAAIHRKKVPELAFRVVTDVLGT